MVSFVLNLANVGKESNLTLMVLLHGYDLYALVENHKSINSSMTNALILSKSTQSHHYVTMG